MKQDTPMQELEKAFRKWQKDWELYDSDPQKYPKPQNIDDFLAPYLEKERQLVKDAVNDTINAYAFFTESPYNPPPMNGIDYFNNKYNAK